VNKVIHEAAMTLFPGAEHFEIGRQYKVVGQVEGEHGEIPLGSTVTVYTRKHIENRFLSSFDDVSDYPCIGVWDAKGDTYYARPSALQPIAESLPNHQRSTYETFMTLAEAERYNVGGGVRTFLPDFIEFIQQHIMPMATPDTTGVRHGGMLPDDVQYHLNRLYIRVNRQHHPVAAQQIPMYVRYLADRIDAWEVEHPKNASSEDGDV
jgi:hypothetical protein